MLGSHCSVVCRSTVTGTPADVVLLPAASRATAVSVCAPPETVDVSHDALNGGAASSAAIATPSTSSCTPTTPTLSLAVADTVTVPDTDALGAGDVIDTVGAVVSSTRVVNVKSPETPR